MDDKDLSKVIKNIIEKELKSLAKIIPSEVFTNLDKKIQPHINDLIEKGGYIKKSKYENLERIIKDLENRLSKIENDQS
ncbi:MAG: hypothetical protein ACJ0FG_01095 [Gammaproteobacteria bacterium]